MERITATVSDEQAAVLRALAAERGTSVASVIRAAADVVAEDGRAAASIRRHVHSPSRGGARAGAGRPRRTWLTAAEAAAAIRRELRSGDDDFAFRLLARLVADLRALDRPSDVTRCLAQPATTGDKRWDTLLAVAVARTCRERGVDVPGWTAGPPLRSWWFPLLADPVLTARTMQRTPVDFAVRGIWLEANALETA